MQRVCVDMDRYEACAIVNEKGFDPETSEDEEEEDYEGEGEPEGEVTVPAVMLSIVEEDGAPSRKGWTLGPGRAALVERRTFVVR